MALLAAAFAVTLHHLRHLYLARYFGYHDVALINDFLASLFHHGRIFHVFDLNINHLAWHFTPSLFLITPLYAVFNSQFLLIAWSTLAMFGGYVALLVAGDRLLGEATAAERALAGLTLAALLGLGEFPWRVATSGHFEQLFILGSGLLLLALVSESPIGWVIAPFLLALGVREDTGAYLASQLAALWFLPAWMITDRRKLRRRALVLAGVALLWTLLVVKLVFPAFGMNENWHAQRLWGQYGSTFSQVAVNLLTHPVALIHEIHNSAFLQLNRSLLFLPWLNPLFAIFANAPGGIFYTTVSPDRKQLLYYTSAMLQPGLFLSCAVGLASLRRWLRGKSAPLFALLALLAIFSSHFLDRIRDENQQTLTEHAEQIAFIDEALHDCPGLTSVASDFRTAVFLPNAMPKYLLWNYGRADAVLYASEGARFTPGLPPESARAGFSGFRPGPGLARA